MQISCSVDCCDDVRVEGWIIDRADPGRRLAVDVLAGAPPHERLLGHAVADRFRADLLQAGLGDGHCAFHLTMPPLARGEPVWLRLHGTDLLLRMPPGFDRPGFDRPGFNRPGAWHDRADWLPALRRRDLPDAVATAIFHLRRDGFVHLPHAVDAATLRLLRAESAWLWQHRPDGLRMECFEPDGHQRMAPADPAMQAGAALLDPHCHTAAIRNALAYPPLHALLAALLDSEPHLQATRLGPFAPTGGGLDQDSVLQATPGYTACLALQAATLTMMPGSHDLPPFPFGPDRAARLDADVTAQDAYQYMLRQHAAQFGCTMQNVQVAAGGIVLRHPELAHQPHDLQTRWLVARWAARAIQS